MLSRVDGSLDEHDLAASTGLKDEQVKASLQKLEALGLIRFDGQRPSAPAGLLKGERTKPEAPIVDDVDLDPALRRRIDELARDIDQLDHYALLCVDRTADRKAIKRAYYDLAAKFHPDRYFRKNLGPFKPRMEVIFSRITIAHDILTGPEKRAEYDAYLEEQRRSRGLEELLAGAAAEAKRAEESVERAVRAQAPPPAPAAPSRPAPQVDVSRRREALARRLLGGGRSAPPASGAAPTASDAPAPMTKAEAMDSLRRRYEARVSQAKAAEARKYVVKAEQALSSGDSVAAANALRVAQELTPNDAELQRLAAEAQSKADAVLGEMYARQARYEEKAGQLADAARSWARVCKARPDDPVAHARAASAILAAGGDLREAARLGKIACELDPKSGRTHATLASVYAAAGFMSSAQRAVETAAQLAPHDDTIASMKKAIGKLI